MKTLVLHNQQWEVAALMCSLLQSFQNSSCRLSYWLGSGVIEIKDKRPTVAMYCHDIPPIKNWRPFCSEQLHRQIIHQNALIFKKKLIDTFTTSKQKK